MNKLITKARSGVTLVELLVVILIVTILSVGLLPLLKPYIEQAKYAAEAQPTLGNIQTKINLYQYERDKLPCTIETVNATTGAKSETAQDNTEYTWMIDTTGSAGASYARAYKKAKRTQQTRLAEDTTTTHLCDYVDVDWQDLMGKRINPSQFQYHVIRGSGAAKYGYAIGIFGDGDGIAKGTGYAILVLVDTANKLKVVATWERYKPVSDVAVTFKADSSGSVVNDAFCHIPTFTDLDNKTSLSGYSTILGRLKSAGWSFNFDDVQAAAAGGGGN